MLTDAEREAVQRAANHLADAKRYKDDQPNVAAARSAAWWEVERIVAERVRQAKADALREAADYIESEGDDFSDISPALARWLRDRADQYDRTEA